MLLLASLLIATVKPSLAFDGQVFLSNGKPAAHAFIANQSFGQGESRGFTDRIECDDQGRFTIPTDSKLLTRVYHVFSKDLKESHMDQTQSREAGFKTIRLQPSCEVTLQFEASGEAGKGNVVMQVMPTLSLPWGGDMDANGRVKVLMPQGEYKVVVVSDENDFAQQSLTLSRPQQEFKVKGQLNPFRNLKGQTAPDLQVQETMGVKDTVSLHDYRGKYLLLEFWGFWCKPCVESSLPSLIQFEKENPQLRSKLAILAIHENSRGGRNLEAIKKHLPTFERDLWGGPLPFPIIVEKAASLTKTYGIRAYPTAVLIDPEGKIVDRADVETLRKLFQHLR